MSPSYELYPLGDSAITVDFGNAIDENLNNKVIALFHHWKEKKLAGVKDIIPAYSSLTIEYDITILRNQNNSDSAFQFIRQQVEQSIENCDWSRNFSSSRIEIPVCYDPLLAPDLFPIAREKKLDIEEVIHLHCNKVYRVYMIGFLPGFAYMGKVDKRISTPRKINPDLLVHAGSVGIAGKQTGIYPFDSPGGWNIIGQTPLKMFDAKKDEPVFLNAGDEVKFVPIELEQFREIKSNQ